MRLKCGLRCCVPTVLRGFPAAYEASADWGLRDAAAHLRLELDGLQHSLCRSSRPGDSHHKRRQGDVPGEGWTKLDVVEHYLMCAAGALRGVRNRPSLLKRWNQGVSARPLFVKRPKGARNLVDVTFPSARPGRMFAPLDEGDVIWMAQMNCLDLNPWNARADDLAHPDELRIDLDPTDDYDFEAARDVAFAVKTLLDELGLVGWPKTSGNRGIHIYVRLLPEWDYFEVRRAALALARELERRHELATAAWWKEERSGVFIDYNQNAWDKTIASAYSIRHTGWVSTPFL